MELNIPKRFFDDNEWAYKHYNELIKKYGDRWVAIYNRKVVASSDDIYDALEKARRRTKIEKIPVIFVEKIPHVYKNRKDNYRNDTLSICQKER